MALRQLFGRCPYRIGIYKAECTNRSGTVPGDTSTSDIYPVLKGMSSKIRY